MDLQPYTLLDSLKDNSGHNHFIESTCGYRSIWGSFSGDFNNSPFRLFKQSQGCFFFFVLFLVEPTVIFISRDVREKPTCCFCQLTPWEDILDFPVHFGFWHSQSAGAVTAILKHPLLEEGRKLTDGVFGQTEASVVSQWRAGGWHHHSEHVSEVALKKKKKRKKQSKS